MNSEELEKSLKTEFESYLKEALADIRQEVFQLQYKIDSELENYKSQIDEVFKEFTEKVREDEELSDSFQESIVEHLRLARDDGATITATAIAEAEELEKQMGQSFDISDLRDAINDISSQTSQATILKSLIDHAERFVPRGAFFVVKNQNFVGWRVFGSENPAGGDAIREVYFETTVPTILSESVRSLRTVEGEAGSFEEDRIFLEPLNFGRPERMVAVPLVARGRGVAAVYADTGEDSGGSVNIAALETLVHIAGLTVELLASSQTAAVSRAAAAPAEESDAEARPEEPAAETAERFEEQEPAEEVAAESYEEPAETYEPVAEEEMAAAPQEEYAEEEYAAVEEEDYAPADVDYAAAEEPSGESLAEESMETGEEPYGYEEAGDQAAYETVTSEPIEEEAVAEEEPAVAEEMPDYQAEPAADETYQVAGEDEPADDFAEPAVEEPVADASYEVYDTTEYLDDEQVVADTAPLNDDFVSDDDLIEETAAPAESFVEDQAAEVGEDAFETYRPVEDEAETSSAPVFGEEDAEEIRAGEPAPVAEPETAPVRSRLARRNVDLPIEVSEEERKLHNDARRFARLLVSEIKLYNEQKVIEGRNSNDLYERLREAIDRSREMYDKRVQPPVAERFDYFHYEIVNTLGEGEESKLGVNYPGAAV